jgi:DNA-binding IclR family transcriptional regulator
MRNTGVQTVDRALQLLLAFDSEGQALGVTELAARLGVHKSTASRLAATLALGGRDLVELARPPMTALAAETGETVNLAVLDGVEAVNVAQVEGRHIVGVGSWTGRRTALHCTANGKVLLAFSRAPLPGSPYDAFTARTITTRAGLERELAAIRRRGYAEAVGELEEGLHAVAAPVVAADGRCCAALSVSGPAYRMPEERLAEIGARCRRSADEVAGLLGGDVRAA